MTKYLDNITNNIQKFFTGFITYDQMILLFHILIAITLLITCFVFFYQIKKYRIIERSVKKVYRSIENRERDREREEESFLLDSKRKIEKEGLLVKLDKKLTYSRIKRVFPWMKTEIYIILVIGMMALSFFGVQIFGGSFLTSLVGAAVPLIIFAATRSILTHINYVATENDLLNLLNLLKNYSISSDEINNIFYRVSKYLNNPLREALEECYYEGKTTGNNELAMTHLIEKIEHPKFKELIQNIEICGRYNADYAAILTNSRRTIQDYISAQKEQKSANKAEMYTFLILVAAGAICFSLMGNMMGINIWNLLVTTTTGHILSCYFIALIGIFFWKIVLFDKN